MVWEQIRSSYDAVAEKYENRFVDEFDGKPFDREILATFAAAAHDPVLEIGCGPGHVGAIVRGHGRRVSGLDFSAEMAGRAHRRLDSAVQADMRSIPIASGALGGLLAFYSLIHMQRPDAPVALREFRRVLRPGAHMLVAAHEGEGEVGLDRWVDEPVPMVVTMFQLDELVAACEAAGFDVVRAERRLPLSTEITTRLFVQATASPATT